MGMKILDTYQGHGPLGAAQIAGFDRVVLKVYDPRYTSWTKDSILFCLAHNTPFDLYITGGGRHEPPATWEAGKANIERLGIDPRSVAVGVDMWEFLRGGGMLPGAAADVVHQVIDDMHADGCKGGGYGSDEWGWNYYDGIPFDWNWVACPYSPPHHRADLHQTGGDWRGDENTTALDQAAWKALTTGPYGQEGKDMDANQAAQLSAVAAFDEGKVYALTGVKPRRDPGQAPFDTATKHPRWRAGWLSGCSEAKALGITPAPEIP